MSRPKTASPKRHDASVSLEPFVDRLYAASLDGFTETRKALVAELKASGAKEEATAIGAMKKPTRTAWALNHVARNEPGALAAFIEATDALRAAQTSAIAKGSPTLLRDASRALNKAIASIVSHAKRALVDAGASLNLAQQRIVQRTLHAIPFAPPEDIARFSKGTLVADLDVASGFGFAGEGSSDALGRAREAGVGGSDDAAPQASHRDESRARDREAKTRAAEREAKRAAGREAKRVAAEAKAHARAATRLDAIARRAEDAATLAEKAAEVASRQAASLASRARDARTKADMARQTAANASAHLHRSAR